jgi:hypothetical protein
VLDLFHPPPMFRVKAGLMRREFALARFDHLQKR